MRNYIRTTILAAMLLIGASAFGAQISIGIRVGPPPPPRVIRILPPPPGPGFMWIQGYWYPAGRNYQWQSGYWTLPPYYGARWVAPRHDGRQFYFGYWDRDRYRYDRDHRWDRKRDRDNSRWRDRDDRGRRYDRD